MRRIVRACRVGVALLALVVAGEAAAQTRVLVRNPATGGAPAITDADLASPYTDAALVEALAQLDGGRAREAIPVLRAWLDDEGTSSLAPTVRFALASALVDLERWDEADDALRACVADGGLFVDYCLFWSAERALEQGDATRAAALALAVSRDAVYGPRSRFLRGRALLQLNDAEAAREELEGFLIDHPDAWYRNDVEFALVEANVALGNFDEAGRALHRLATVNPGRDVETRAERELDAIRDRLSAETRRRVSASSTSDTVDRAQVLFDRHRSDDVIAMLRPIVESLDDADAEACRANYLIARSYTKLRRHSDSIVYYDPVAASCAADDLVIRTLYNLGRAYWNVDRDDEAVETFQRIWEEFPLSTYADDAMLYAAQVRRGQGRASDARALLERQIRDFTGGDMLADAVWELFAESYRAGDYRAAAEFAASVETRTGERDLYTRGRIRYFRARALEQLSLRAEARAEFAEVMRQNPMSFYALLAWNRLAAIDATAADALAAELRAGGDRTEDVIRLEPAELRTDPFLVRGMELLRVGLDELARGELGRLEDRYPNQLEVGWVVALLYHRSGAHELAHHVPGERTGLNLWYPAGTNLERWQIAYPRPFTEHVERWAEERGLDPFLVWAIMREESGFRPDIESWANARGLLQLMLPTANDMAAEVGRGRVTAQQLFDPAVNVELGTMYMRRLSDLFDAHPALVIAGYNGGQGNVRSWLRARGEVPFDFWVEEIPYSQTRDYVKRVTMTLWIYHWLYGDTDAFVFLPQDLSGI